MAELTVHDGLLATAKRSKKKWLVTKQSVEPFVEVDEFDLFL